MIRTAVFVIALAVAGLASADPIFPPLVSGEYAFGVRTAELEVDGNGIPTRAASRSIGIYEISTPATLLLCAPAGPTGYGDTIRVSVTVSAAGDRAELRAVAFSEPDCAGQRSIPCDDGAYIFFTPPAQPALEP